MASCSDSTPRRSARLTSTGYYDCDGKPYITYKETLYKTSKRHGHRVHFNSDESYNDMDFTWNNTDSNRNHDSNRTRTDWNRWSNRGTNRTLNDRDGTRHRLGSSVFNCKTFRFLFLVLPLCLGFVYMTPTLSSNLFKYLCNAKCKGFLRELLTPEGDTLPNFALESLGASIICHLTSGFKFFGIHVRRPPNGANSVIQGHLPLIPGVCWAFGGDRGRVFISLPKPVTISHVTLGHIPKNLSPTASIPSAPKEFSVYGMQSLDDKGTQLGSFVYDQDGDPIQTFKLPDQNQVAFKYVCLQVESNWGHPDYTCLYNFRVHGTARLRTVK